MNCGESAPKPATSELLQPDVWAVTIEQDGIPDITLYFKSEVKANEEATKWKEPRSHVYVVPIYKFFQD
jgi:hypothetical protein